MFLDFDKISNNFILRFTTSNNVRILVLLLHKLAGWRPNLNNQKCTYIQKVLAIRQVIVVNYNENCEYLQYEKQTICLWPDEMLFDSPNDFYQFCWTETALATTKYLRYPEAM